jgi:hypothetical protein
VKQESCHIFSHLVRYSTLLMGCGVDILFYTFTSVLYWKHRPLGSYECVMYIDVPCPYLMEDWVFLINMKAYLCPL